MIFMLLVYDKTTFVWKYYFEIYLKLNYDQISIPDSNLVSCGQFDDEVNFSCQISIYFDVLSIVQSYHDQIYMLKNPASYDLF